MKRNDLFALLLWTLWFTIGIFLFIISFLPKAHADSTWWTGTYKKLNAMVTMGWAKDNAVYFINQCKWSKHPANCVLIGTFISCAESTCTKLANDYNIFGIESDGTWVHFKSDKEAIDFWIGRFNKYWWKWNKPYHYYGKNPKTKYCHPEKANNWGRNGLNNSTRAYAKFISLTK